MEKNHTLERRGKAFHCTTCGSDWVGRPQSLCPGILAFREYPSGVLTRNQLERLNLTVTGEPDAVVWRFRHFPPVPVYSISRINERLSVTQRRALALRTHRHTRCESCLELSNRRWVRDYKDRRFCSDCVRLTGDRRFIHAEVAVRIERMFARRLRCWSVVPRQGLSTKLFPLLQLRAAELEHEVGQWRDEYEVERTTALLDAVARAKPEILERFELFDDRAGEVRKLDEVHQALAELKVQGSRPEGVTVRAIKAAADYLDKLDSMANPYGVPSLEEDRQILVWFALWLYNRHHAAATLGFSPVLELSKRAQEWAALMAWYSDARDDARAWLIGSKARADSCGPKRTGP